VADTQVPGPAPASAEDLGVPIASTTFLGANGAAWAAGNDLVISPPCRAVRCAGAGNLHVSYPGKRADGTTDWTDTIPVLAGETIQGQFDKLFADSTVATGITIQW